MGAGYDNGSAGLKRASSSSMGRAPTGISDANSLRVLLSVYASIQFSKLRAHLLIRHIERLTRTLQLPTLSSVTCFFLVA